MTDPGGKAESPERGSAKGHQLLLAIARCTEISACLERPDLDHPCRDIIVQQRRGQSRRHVPEPWSGHLRAPILFVSSNPSIDPGELFPTANWSDASIVDFFENRFGGGAKPWVTDGLHPLTKKGTPRKEGVAFWAAVRRRAEELLERPARPGVDYTISEVVHCKSENEAGVQMALEVCTRKYLRRVISASRARVIVVLGRVAEWAVKERLGLPERDSIAGPVRVGHRGRHFAFLPHPNARGPRTFVTCLHAEDLDRLRAVLARQ